MAKRSSEHQITRDDDSEGEEEVRVGMTKADPTVLASRPMRGLPKRKGATPLATSSASSNGSSAEPSSKPTFSGFGGFGTTPAAPTETKPEAPRFGGFTGFGASAAAPVTAAAAPKPAEAPRFAAFTGFGAPPAPAAKTDAPVESKPAEPPRFGNFAGFGTVKPTTTTAATSTPKPEAPKAASESKSDTTAALTYWTSLRGLNHAFSENLKKSIEADMFCDLSVSFKQYQEFREKVVKDYEQAKKTAEAPLPTETKPAETKPAFGFGVSSSSSAKDSPFSFGSNTLSTGTGTSKPPSFGLGLPTSKPLGFGSTNPPLVTPAATPPVEPPSPKKPAPFTSALGAVPEATPTPSPLPGAREPNPFEISATKSNASTPKPAASEEKEKPSTNVFGGSAPKPAFTFGSGASTPFGSTTTKPDAKPFSFNTSNTGGFSGFGSSAAPSPPVSTTTSAGSSVPPSTKPFAFTTPLSTPGTPFAFGAGSPKNNATPRPGSSVGFSFGNSPPRKEPTSFPFGNSVTGPTSGEATPKSETGPSNSDEEKDKPKEGEPEEEDTDKAQTAGAGEENEDTLYTARARVLRFYKQAWVGVGIGQFKIKFDRETRKRRILHRLEGTGRVVLNCGLFDQMNPVLEPKGLVRFTATDDQGHPMLYRVKVKAETDAEALVNTFKEALEAYQAEKND